MKFLLLLALWLPDNQVRLLEQLSDVPMTQNECLEAVNNPIVRESYLVDAFEKADKNGEFLLLCSPIKEDARKADVPQ